MRSHHKTGKAAIGPIELSEAAGTPPEMLELCEVVYLFGQRALADHLGVEGVDGARAFRMMSGQHKSESYNEDNLGCTMMSKRIKAVLASVLAQVPELSGITLTHKMLRKVRVTARIVCPLICASALSLSLPSRQRTWPSEPGFGEP